MARMIFQGKYHYGSTFDVLGYTAWGTSKDYYYAKFESISYTFEGVYRNEAKNIQLHEKMWNQILGLF